MYRFVKYGNTKENETNLRQGPKCLEELHLPKQILLSFLFPIMNKVANFQEIAFR